MLYPDLQTHEDPTGTELISRHSVHNPLVPQDLQNESKHSVVLVTQFKPLKYWLLLHEQFVDVPELPSLHIQTDFPLAQTGYN